MIPIVITIIVIVLYKVYITNKENNIRIKELEVKLTEYYKERERRLNDSLHSKDNDLIK